MNRKKIIPVLVALFFVFTAAHAQKSTLVVVEENGLRSRRINIVFLSEGYAKSDLPNFAVHVDNAVNYLFSREPWKQYRSYFNIYRIEIESNESGTDNGTGGGTKDTYFNSGFNTPSIGQLLTIPASGQSRGYALLNEHVPEYDMPVFIVNDAKYGGSGGAISVASVNTSSALLVEHEVGHSFADLADEYDTEYLTYTPAESYNATRQTNPNLIRWKSWIETGTPVPTPEISTYNDDVGLFEGANYRVIDWYRPHNNSLMRNLGKPVGAVNREKFVITFYEKVGPVDAHTPESLVADVAGPQNLTFSVTPKSPSELPELTVQWKVNGVDRVGETAGDFIISSGELGEGSHTVTAVVTDPTAFVRDDPGNLLAESVTWAVNVFDQLPGTLAAWRLAFGPDDSNPSGDGINNIAKYALGLDPGTAVSPTERPSSSMTETAPDEKYLMITVPRNVRRTDIDYSVQSSGMLGNWNSGAGHTVVIEDSPTLLKVRDAVPVNSADARFLNFSVSEPGP